MATITQVIETLADIVGSIVYPNGENQPSIIGTPINIIPGWPIKNTLDDMLLTGVPVISVYSDNNERNAPKFLPIWFSPDASQSTLNFVSAGDTVIFSGTPAAGESVYVQIGNISYNFSVESETTLEDIAEYFAVETGGSSDGPEFTVPGALQIIVRIATKEVQYLEVKRQNVAIRVIIWANNFETRDQIAQVLEPELGNLNKFVLPDNFYANIQHGKNVLLDRYEMKEIYRQDLVYLVSYPSTLTKDAYAITKVETPIQTNPQNFMLTAPTYGNITLVENEYTQPFGAFTITGADDSYHVTLTVSDMVGILIAEDSNFESSYGKGYSMSKFPFLTTAEVQTAVRNIYIGYFEKPNSQITVEVSGSYSYSKTIYYVMGL